MWRFWKMERFFYKEKGEEIISEHSVVGCKIDLIHFPFSDKPCSNWRRASRSIGGALLIPQKNFLFRTDDISREQSMRSHSIICALYFITKMRAHCSSPIPQSQSSERRTGYTGIIDRVMHSWQMEVPSAAVLSRYPSQRGQYRFISL